MRKATDFSKLNFTNKPIIPKTAPIQNKRNKLLNKLNEQRDMAECAIDNKIYKSFKDKLVTDPETGVTSKVQVPKRVRPWFYEVNGDYYLEVKYGAKVLELQKGKPAILVGKEDKLLSVLDTVIEAVDLGELDDVLLAQSAASKKLN